MENMHWELTMYREIHSRRRPVFILKFQEKWLHFQSCLYDETWKRIALEDYLIRQFGAAIGKYSFQAKGSGKSGIISVTRCSQEILKRSACEINPKMETLACDLRLDFRKWKNHQCKRAFKNFIRLSPGVRGVSSSHARQDKKKVERVMELSVDQQYIREQLKEQGLVAFVADKAVLPRESGVSAKPMKGACHLLRRNR